MRGLFGSSHQRLDHRVDFLAGGQFDLMQERPHHNFAATVGAGLNADARVVPDADG
jgi:hypothetical protein